MTLEAALEERDMKASELIRRSGVSAPTIHNCQNNRIGVCELIGWEVEE